MKKRNKCRQMGIAGVLTFILLLNGCQNINDISKKGAQDHIDVAGVSEVENLLRSGGKTLEELCAEASILYLNVGEEGKIKMQVADSDAVLYRLLYTSSNDRICTVQQDGTLLGVSDGKATVTIQDAISGLSAKVVVLVSDELQPENISLSQAEVQMTAGEKITLQASVEPKEAKEVQILWSSSDDSIAIVDPSGVVTAKKTGSCVITASVKGNEEIKAEAQIQVTDEKEEDLYDTSGSKGDDSQGSSGGNSSSGNSGSSGNAGTGSNSGNSNGNNSSNQGSAGGSGNTGSSTGTTESNSSPYYMDSYAEQVLSIVNARRQEAGIAPLTMNYTLVNAAKVRASEITQSFSHTRPDGRSCFTAFDEAGVGYSGAGENIAAGQWSPDSVMNSWMNSEGHRANIMNPSFTQIGIACYYVPGSAYGYYWVQCFIS